MEDIHMARAYLRVSYLYKCEYLHCSLWLLRIFSIGFYILSTMVLLLVGVDLHLFLCTLITHPEI